MQEMREDTERAARRQMRVHPPLSTAKKSTRTAPPERGTDDENRRRREDAERKAIVSVYGRDLSSEDEIAHAQEEPRKEEAA